MPHKALIYSVPGSGTMFTREILRKCLGYQHKDLPVMLKHSAPRNYSQIHVDDVRLDMVLDKAGVKTIIPVRDPVSTFLTRHNNMSGGLRARKLSEAFWGMLIDTIDQFDYVLLPVAEDYDHEMMAQRVIDHLDAPIEYPDAYRGLVRDWPLINSQGEKTMRKEYEETGLVEGRDVSFLDFAMEWYEQQLAGYYP
jgi:hypothetical protein